MDIIVYKSVMSQIEEKVKTQKIHIGQFESNINDPDRSNDRKVRDKEHQAKFKDRLILYERMLASIKQ